MKELGALFELPFQPATFGIYLATSQQVFSLFQKQPNNMFAL